MRIACAFASVALLVATFGYPAEACDAKSHGQACSCEPSSAERHARAGNATHVAPWAKLAYGPKYMSYVVGGSQAPFAFTPRVRQDPRQLSEGTWGTDYAPWYTKVRLNWTHGQLFQGGKGQYEPDHKHFPFGLRFGGSHRK